MLVSTADGADEGDELLPLRSYRIVDGEVSEEDVRSGDREHGMSRPPAAVCNR